MRGEKEKGKMVEENSLLIVVQNGDPEKIFAILGRKGLEVVVQRESRLQKIWFRLPRRQAERIIPCLLKECHPGTKIEVVF